MVDGERRRGRGARSNQTGRFEADHPNDIWQCDHHLLDILVINEETGKPEYWVNGWERK